MNKYPKTRPVSAADGSDPGAGGTSPVARARAGGDGGAAAGLLLAEANRRDMKRVEAGARLRQDGAAGAIDSAFVVARLEEAGATLLALPAHGYSTALRTSKLDIVRDAVEAYGHDRVRMRPPMPDSGRVSRMDEAFGWLGLIPLESFMLRRIVGARALVSPLTQRHLFSWRRLGEAMGADHKAVQRWHAQGIDWLVRELAEAAGAVRRSAGRE